MKRSKLRYLTILVVFWIGILACSVSGGPPGSPPDAEIIVTTSDTKIDKTPTASPFVPTNSPSTLTPTSSINPTEELVLTNTPSSPTLTESPTATITLEPTSTLQEPLEEPSATLLPTQTIEASITTIPTQEVVNTTNYQQILNDSFNGGGAWAESAVDGRYDFGYTADAYQFTLEIPLIDVWSIRGKVYGDLMQEVDIFDFQGSIDGYAGLVCRWQKSTEYYRFTISSAGEYRITKVSGGTVEDLAQKTVTPIVLSASNPVRFKAVCSGENLVLYRDNEVVLQAQDQDLQSGNFGLMAGSNGNGSMSVKFDNYALYVP